jgi:hypothetical protein
MKNFALRCLILLFSLSLLFHILVLLQVIPYAIVWGGRLRTDADMYGFEAVSLLVNIVSLVVLLLKSGTIRIPLRQSVVNAALWIMCSLMALNTVGNLYSGNHLERIIFTPLTLVSSILLLIILLRKD